MPIAKNSNIDKYKIKILHIVSSNKIGGAENVILTQLRTIDREKFELIFGIFIEKKLDGKKIMGGGGKGKCSV